MTTAGYAGFAYMQNIKSSSPEVPAGFGAPFNQPDDTNESFAIGSAPFIALNGIEGVTALALPFEFPSFSAYTDTFLIDLNIVQNVTNASRLLTRGVVWSDTKREGLVDTAIEYEAGFNFMGRVKNDTRAETAVHPAWAESMGVLSFGANWKDDAPFGDTNMLKEMVVEQS